MSTETRDKRINLVLPMRTIARIEKLKEKTCAASATEVIRSAILAYEALVDRIADGNEFYATKRGENQFHLVKFVFDVLPKTAVVEEG